MKLYVGIDLGSTTTKAVVMADGGVILGKGITNSRSNYDTACAIAKTEAFIDTRFSLFRRQLQDEAADKLAARNDAARRLDHLDDLLRFKTRQYTALAHRIRSDHFHIGNRDGGRDHNDRQPDADNNDAQNGGGDDGDQRTPVTPGDPNDNFPQDIEFVSL